MSKVVFDMSMSLDGFVCGSGRTKEEPLGQDGERLHEWAFGNDDANAQLMSASAARLGAMITGRVTYDDSVPFWGADGPTGPARLPVFVVTHKAPEDSPPDSVYTFVTDGIEAALDAARAAAGEKDIVMDGTQIGQQYLTAGLVDEVAVHVVPVLFGTGKRMFDGLPDRHISLELVDEIRTPLAVHLRYAVRR